MTVLLIIVALVLVLVYGHEIISFWWRFVLPLGVFVYFAEYVQTGWPVALGIAGYIAYCTWTYDIERRDQL